MDLGGVCVRIREKEEDILVYHFGSVREAAKTLAFVAEFFPSAQVIVEPLRH